MAQKQINEVLSILADLDDYIKSEQKRLKGQLNYYKRKYKEYEEQCETLAEKLVKQTQLARHNNEVAEMWKATYEALASGEFHYESLDNGELHER